MVQRRVSAFVLCLLISVGTFFWLMQGVSAAPSPIPLQATSAPDCVALSQQGQQTLLSAMTALLGADPAGSQFSDATAFVPQELIVGSTPADIAAVNNLGAQFGLSLAPIGNPLTVGAVTLQRFALGGDGSDQTNSVRRVICEVDQWRATGVISTTAYAEPNYRISASQWWAAGSRWRDDNLSQYMLEHTGDTLTDFDGYRAQWAFGAEGINLAVNGTRTISQTGSGTRVVLFDSSPFAESGRMTMTANVDGQPTPLFALQTTERLPQTTFANSAFPDHGIFVAGLIHAVAPAADLELVRVLGNNDGRGTLFDLLTALQEFYDRNGDANTLDLHGTVMNLSVGVHHPLLATFPTLALTDTFGLPDEVLSLKQLLRYGYDHGAIIVAAAGNDFAFGEDDTPWSETPAAYDFVISVGGSNHGGSHSCFSNNGELFAPAGDGADSDCSGPSAQECHTNPTACVASVIHDDQGATNAGFGYWVGSSFAAPQVSGLAALILEALTPTAHQGLLQRAATPPAKISAVLHCGTQTGTNALAVNVIDVAKTLGSNCLALGETRPGQIRFQQSAVSVLENSGTLTLTVERVNGSDGAVSITADTFDGTATVGQDYPATSLNVDFADGQTTQQIAIPIFDDPLEEAPETFIVRLGTVLAGQATVTNPSEVVVTILDDESTLTQLSTYLPLIER